jgi:DNA polymerase III subunit epsilon
MASEQSASTVPDPHRAPGHAIVGSGRYGSQATFDELGTPLRDVTFVVVDLETTGGSPLDCEITEVGAVKVRGGVVEGEFQTLVNPGGSIPAFVQLLTGITESMVATAPTIASVLPAFLEFAKGPDVVLVAHNAPFDVGFLRAAADRTAQPWPTFGILDTARLARQVLLRDEAPDCRLATLARLFRATTMPTHRALEDARATVDVLHGLIERVGTQGVDTLEELSTYSARVSPAQRRKRHLAEGLPRGPGVYLFEDADGRVLYVGKSKDLRPRVRSYFTASEMRTRMAEMVRLAEHVRPVPCPTLLEAEVRELRLIAQHQPPYNRRSRFPERVLWLKLTVEAFPRLSLVRTLKDDGAAYLGPFSSRRAADAAMTALHEAVPLRQCTPRIPADPSRARGSACALFGIGRCQAPCEGRVTESEYEIHVDVVRRVFAGDCRTALGTLEERIRALSDAGRFEDAGMRRDRLGALVAAAARMQRLRGLVAAAELVAARPSPGDANGSNEGWELAVVRHGRLAGTDSVARGLPVWPKVDALLATSERVASGTGPTPAATAEESECILRWLGGNGTRLVQVSGTWSSPAHGAGAVRDRYAPRAAADATQPPGTDRRRLRPIG